MRLSISSLEAEAISANQRAFKKIYFPTIRVVRLVCARFAFSFNLKCRTLADKNLHHRRRAGAQQGADDVSGRERLSTGCL